MIGTDPGQRQVNLSVDDTAGQHDVARLLSTFLSGRDVPCPLCHYNLRDLERPQCPECRHELLLTVGVTRPRFLWFLLAVTPCTASGIAACLLLIGMVFQALTGGGLPPWQGVAIILSLDGLGLLSGLAGLALLRYRFAFLRQPPNRQRVHAVAVWGTHVLAFLAWWLAILVISGGP